MSSFVRAKSYKLELKVELFHKIVVSHLKAILHKAIFFVSCNVTLMTKYFRVTGVMLLTIIFILSPFMQEFKLPGELLMSMYIEYHVTPPGWGCKDKRDTMLKIKSFTFQSKTHHGLVSNLPHVARATCYCPKTSYWYS